jgi:hypothetical protein
MRSVDLDVRSELFHTVTQVQPGAFCFQMCWIAVQKKSAGHLVSLDKIWEVQVANQQQIDVVKHCDNIARFLNSSSFLDPVAACHSQMVLVL